MQNTKEPVNSDITADRLAELCVPQNLTRSDYFSDTYSCVFNVDGIAKLMDITHISLPFETQHRKAVEKHFGFDDDDMEAFYHILADCITNNVRLTKTLIQNHTDSIVDYVECSIKQKPGRGSDIFLITEHLRPLTEVYFNGETTLSQIFSLGTRLAKVVKDIHQNPDSEMAMRVIDPEQIFVNDDGMLVFNTFQYAFFAKGNKPPIPITAIAPPHIHPSVISGGKGSIGTDMYSIASILWSLLNGDGFNQIAAVGKTPQYASEDMAETLRIGLQANDGDFKPFRKKLNDILNSLTKTGEGQTKVPVVLSESYCSNSAEIQNSNIPDAVLVSPKKPNVPESTSSSAADMPEDIPDITDTIISANETVSDYSPKPDGNEAVLQTTQEADNCISGQYSAYSSQDVPDNYAEIPVERSIIVLDRYLEAVPAVSSLHSADIDTILSFAVVYNRPKYVIKRILFAIGIMLVIASVIYVSISTHLIPLI